MNCFENAFWIENPRYETARVSRFTKTFTLSQRPRRATLRITAGGWYASALNGRSTDEEYFKPLLSDYGKRELPGNMFFHFEGTQYRVYYNTFDVTDLLILGENRLSVDLAGGWYHHKEKLEEGDFSYGTPRLLFLLTLETDDGSLEIGSDGTVSVSTLPVIATIFKGETVDFTASPSAAVAAAVIDPPGGELTEAEMKSDTLRAIHAPKVVKVEPGKQVWDFGVNHTGFLQGTVQGPRGGRVKLVFGEHITADGELNHISTSWGTQIQQDEYTLSGGLDSLAPKFTYHGYRYAELTYPEGTDLDLRSFEICADLREIGKITSDDPIFEQITKLYTQTQLSNMHGGVPSDCPHRERRGYTGDGQVTCASALYLLNAEDFYRKWYRDILDSQQVSGYVPNTAPFSGGGGGYGWGYAICRVADVLYGFTGDRKVAEAAYPAIRRWVEFLGSRAEESGLLSYKEDIWSLGDWFCLDEVKIDYTFVCTCFYLASVQAARKFAALLGLPDSYAVLERKLASAIHTRFYDPAIGSYAKGEQGADALALSLGLVPQDERKKVENSLIMRYRSLGYIDTGIHCLLPLCRQLTALGETELLYQMLTRRAYPSYGYMLENGATTLWESWSKDISPKYRLSDGVLRDGYPVSHNHPMFGSICEFLFDSVGGLDLSSSGFGKVTYKPLFTGELSECCVEREMPNGLLSAAYSVINGNISVELTVPRGFCVQVLLPTENDEGNGSYNEGCYQITGKLRELDR